MLTGLPEGVYPVRALAYRHEREEGQSRPTLRLLREMTVDLSTEATGRIDIPAEALPK